MWPGRATGRCGRRWIQTELLTLEAPAHVAEDPAQEGCEHDQRNQQHGRTRPNTDQQVAAAKGVRGSGV